MIQYPEMTPAPNGRETKIGFVWLGFTLLFAPSVVYLLNSILPNPLSDGLLNTVYYGINFAVIILIFRQYLAASMEAALARPFPVIWYAILGYLGFQVLSELLSGVIFFLYPDFRNVNDDTIFAMLDQDLVPLAMATIFLVPLAEETLYRGLFFRKLFDKKPIAAYLVSMAAFAAIHVMGYVGTYSPLLLLLCFVQYLPAGYCLCWCYRQTGTVLCPVLMHTIVNAVSIYYYLR